MRIGNIEIEPNLVLAPMAGITNYAYRILAKEMGAGLVCAEMVSDKGLIYGNETTARMLYVGAEERPLSMQLFGSDVESMVAATELVNESDADIIDINMGCPAPKIVKPGGGAALMRDLDKAEAIIQAVVKRATKPVTVKMRKGWDNRSVNAVELAKRAEAAGASAVTVHGRTRDEMYSGVADWDIIAQVVAAVDIPVIGNGDVTDGPSAQRMFDVTGCRAAMIGRAAQGNPWIFRQIQAYLQDQTILPPPTVRERIDLCIRQLDILLEFKPEHVAVPEMRKHAAWYFKGLPQVALVRNQIMTTKTREDLVEVLEGYAQLLE